MINKDLIEVTRCKNCCYFTPIEKLYDDYFYTKTFMKVGINIKANGYCENVNLWVYFDDYCSQATPKE